MEGVGKSRYRTTWWRVLEIAILLSALAGALHLRLRVVLPAYVGSRSMEPTLRVGDYVLINRRAYQHRLPALGDIIALNTLDREEVWLKRVVAGPGDVIELRGGVLYRNGQACHEPYIQEVGHYSFPRYRVPRNHVFVLGDNRDRSEDSRVWGPLRRDYIVGRVFFVYWPCARMRRT
ncbi:MAG: signal peptidase I [Armatimonadetes bacterium]|nr:signal peptidase I [Armatimonadota bacterium]